MHRFVRTPIVATLVLAGFGCSGGGSKTHAVGGDVSGLGSGELVLGLSDGQLLRLTGSGAFRFPAALPGGASYQVTVVSAPARTLVTLDGAAGTVDGTVDTIHVVVEPGYTVGGTVTGLEGPMTLQLNGGNDLTITEDGTFAFPTLLRNGDAWTVTVLTPPAGQPITTAGTSGTIAGGDAATTSLHARHWTTPADAEDGISPGTTSAYQASIASAGTSFLVTWRQYNGTHYHVYASMFRDGTWTHPANLQQKLSLDGQHASTPVAAMSTNGDAVIVWLQSDGAYQRVFKAELRNGTWSVPLATTDAISPTGQHAYTPAVAMDAQGDTLVAWHELDGSRNQIFVSRYHNGAWVHPAGLTDNISPDGENAQDATVAMDPAGNAVVGWYQRDGSFWQAFASTLHDGLWTHPSGLTDNVSPNGSNVYGVRAACAANGDAVLTWAQFDGADDRIYKSELRNGTWTHPASLQDAISPAGDDAWDPVVAMGPDGRTVILWEADDAFDTQVFMSEYVDGAWHHPADIDDHISPSAVFSGADTPQVAFGADGSAIVVWEGWDYGNNYVYASRLVRGQWYHPGYLDIISVPGASAYSPVVALDSQGNAVAAYNGYGWNNGKVYISTYR